MHRLSRILWTIPLAACLQAAPCVNDTLANYVALGSPGCTIGLFTYKDFAFSSTVLGGVPTVLTSAGINLTPLNTIVTFGFNFASGGFSVTGNEGVQYDIRYTTDPPPPILRGMDLDMETNTPVFPGIASIQRDVCIGAAFVLNVCGGTPMSLSVFHNGTSSDTSNSITFGDTNIIGVHDIIILRAFGASANFTSYSGVERIPEPATFWLAGAALLAAWKLRQNLRTS